MPCDPCPQGGWFFFFLIGLLYQTAALPEERPWRKFINLCCLVPRKMFFTSVCHMNLFGGRHLYHEGLHGKNGLSARVKPCDKAPFAFIEEAVKVIKYIRTHSDWGKKKIRGSFLASTIAEATANWSRSKELRTLIVFKVSVPFSERPEFKSKILPWNN